MKISHDMGGVLNSITLEIAFLSILSIIWDFRGGKDPGENNVALKTPSLHGRYSECGTKEGQYCMYSLQFSHSLRFLGTFQLYKIIRYGKGKWIIFIIFHHWLWCGHVKSTLFVWCPFLQSRSKYYVRFSYNKNLQQSCVDVYSIIVYIIE